MAADYPPINLPAPVLVLAAGAEGVWAGGTGGIARYHEGRWVPYLAGLPLTGIGGLALAEGWIFVGGVEGLARSGDGGASWQLATLHGTASSIAAIAASPGFAQDHAALAATLDGGVLRTENAGESWAASNFGLSDFEVTALLWLSADVVLAGTNGGVYRSPNGGRAWRAAGGSEGQPVAALVQLPAGGVLAALENGGFLLSADGANWTAQASNLPADTQPSALIVTDDGSLILGAANGGIFRSVDGGASWQMVHSSEVFALAANGGQVCAGTGTGLLVSTDGGSSFAPASPSPLHDLRRLLLYNGQPLVYGRYSGALYYDDAWKPVTDLAPPLSLIAAAPDGRLYASGMDGLFCLTAQGWEKLAEGQAGDFAQMAFRADGTIWACSADYAHLFRSRDSGQTWETSPTPFGVLPLAALDANDRLVFAVTFDPRQNLARLWRSTDDGVNWQRGAEVRTPWPVVATHPDPTLIGLGGMLIVEQSDDNWQRGEVADLSGFLVRKFASADGLLLALTTGGLLRSDDAGQNWALISDFPVPMDTVMDIALEGRTLYVLEVGGSIGTHLI